jgi:hypothetical protein
MLTRIIMRPLSVLSLDEGLNALNVTRIILRPLSALSLDEGLNALNGKIRQLLSGSTDKSIVRY